MSSTHTESLGEGYSVTIQHCEKEECDEYLGVNYPSSFCTTPFQKNDHAPVPAIKESK